MIDALRVLDKPLVGAVRGAAVGSGATMLTYFDFVCASQNARFQYPFINLALVPEFGTSFSLPDQVGYLRAAEIVLLGHHQGPARCRSPCHGGNNRTGVGTEVISCTQRV